MPTNKTLAWIVLTIVGAAIAAAGAFLAFQNYSRTLDTLMKDVLVHVGQVQSYTQDVSTEVRFPDRTLGIVGTYHINRKSLHYGSFSTTTLNIDGLGEHTFSVENMSFGDTIYTRVHTESSLLAKTIGQTNGWKSFLNTAIPQELENIALPGPTLDNFLLFGENGRFIRLEEKMGEEVLDGTPVHHYRFSLSGQSPETPGPVRALVERIGPTGTIDVWVDAATTMIRELRFTNDSYSSKTIISNVDTPLLMSPPPLTP